MNYDGSSLCQYLKLLCSCKRSTHRTDMILIIYRPELSPATTLNVNIILTAIQCIPKIWRIFHIHLKNRQIAR